MCFMLQGRLQRNQFTWLMWERNLVAELPEQQLRQHRLYRPLSLLQQRLRRVEDQRGQVLALAKLQCLREGAKVRPPHHPVLDLE